MLIIAIEPQTRTKTGTPVTLANAKKQCNIETSFTDDDTLLNDLTAAAIEQAENDTNSDILETANVLTVELEAGFQSKIRVIRTPLKLFTKLEYSADGVTYVEILAAELTITPGFHYFEIKSTATITGATWLRLTFTTGYAAASIPKVLKQAVLILLADLYDTNRQGYNESSIVKNDIYSRLISKHIRNYF